MATLRNRNQPWSDLPQELLSAIANSLNPTPFDVLAFRSVYNSWRSSFPRLPHPSLLSPPLPLTLPRPSCIENSVASLTVTVIYALRPPMFSSSSSSSSSPSWFLFLDERTPAKLGVRQPFFDYSRNLPFTFPKTVGLVESRPCELGHFYNLRYEYNHNRSVEVSKVVLSPDRSTTIALFNDGTLWMLMLNLGFSEWEIIHDAKEFRFDDIVEFKGRVLGADRSGTLYEIMYGSFNMNVVFPPIVEAGGTRRRKRLVESLGMLYLIVGFDADPTTNAKTRITKFKVFQLIEETKEWFEVSSIGDRSFFFGFHFSFSVSAQELGSCGKNYVFFRERSFRTRQFYIKDCDFRIYHLNDDIRAGEIGSYPGYSDVLWPPPSWIWGVDRLKRLEALEIASDRNTRQVF